MAVDNDSENPSNGKMEFVHKASKEALLLGLETSEGLYQAVLRVKTANQVHVTIDAKQSRGTNNMVNAATRH